MYVDFGERRVIAQIIMKRVVVIKQDKSSVRSYTIMTWLYVTG